MPDQPELRQRLAEAIFQHSVCDCGEYADDFNEQCMHVAARLLSLPGIAITPVPKPESTTTDIDGDGLKTAQFPHDITAWSGEYPGVMDCDADMSIEVARSLAASLLAAANFAEAGVAEEQTNA